MPSNFYAMRTNVCLTLPDDLATWLDNYAAARHLPRSYAAQELLERCSRGEASSGQTFLPAPGHGEPAQPQET